MLRSDHKAVQSCFLLPSAERHRRKRRRPRRTNWAKYTEVAQYHTCDPNGDLLQFEKELGDLVQACEDTSNETPMRPWDSAELQNLRYMRRNAGSTEERKRISKLIWRLTRDGLRVYRTKQATDKLNEFRKLESLQKLHMYPITKTHTAGPNLESCAKLLQKVFTTDKQREYETNYSVMPFSLEELEFALKRMRKGRCHDKDGFFLEMFLYFGSENLQILCNHLNHILHEKSIPEKWCDTFFSLLHKGGPTEDANNWRPIAILSITYKIFARLVYQRIRQDLNEH